MEPRDARLPVEASTATARSPKEQFLIRVADALRPIADPIEVQAVVTRMLADHFDASRVMYAEIADGKEVVVHRDAVRTGASVVGRYPWELFMGPELLRAWEAGELFIVEDVANDPNLGQERARFQDVGVAAILACGLKKAGRWVAGLGVHSAVPRVWTDDEKWLLEELAERTWAEVQRAHSEAALRESEEKYRTLFMSVDEGFCLVELVVDSEGRPQDNRYLETNPAFARHTGLSGAAGHTYGELTGGSLESHWLELMAEVVRTGEPRRTDGPAEALDRWYEASFARVGPPEARRLACVFKDITERKRFETLMQLALEREQSARAAAEEATSMREQFLRVVSHELATPLSAILIWAKVLRTGSVPGAQVDAALDAITTNAEIQQQLVHDLLDASRLSAGKIQLTVESEELAPIVEAALTILRPTALARDIELALELETPGPRCFVDRGRLHQVLYNLIGNALKFTPSGGHVTVTLRSTPETAIIEVRDDGLGIAPEFLPHVFDSFRQADASQTRAYGGLGLGLTIARQLVELHGGAISAVSDGQGQGATFRVELPRGAAGLSLLPHTAGDEYGSESTLSPETLRGLRILLVEDESHTRAVLSWLLQSHGADVVALDHPALAREALAYGGHFDALVCDLGLPEDDVCTLLPVLRSLAPEPLPALALTAYVHREDRERAMRAGFDAFLPKPVAPRAFIEAVAELVG